MKRFVQFTKDDGNPIWVDDEKVIAVHTWIWGNVALSYLWTEGQTSFLVKETPREILAKLTGVEEGEPVEK
jgi:DNA/RNA-binding domain of Phe-tRNA-synthetase-like protein